jgi:hypothetical protein
VLLLVRSDNSEVAWWRLATVGEAAVGAEQSSEERRSNSGRGERNGWWPPVVMSGHRDKGPAITPYFRKILKIIKLIHFT